MLPSRCVPRIPSSPPCRASRKTTPYRDGCRGAPGSQVSAVELSVPVRRGRPWVAERSRCTVCDELGECCIAHPRWSEAPTGLAARCIGALPAKGTAFDVSVARCAGVVLKLDRRYLTELHVPMTDGRPFGLLPLSAGRHAPRPPWQLAQWCLADDAWGQLAEPPMPMPIAVQVHHSGATEYCRTA